MLPKIVLPLLKASSLCVALLIFPRLVIFLGYKFLWLFYFDTYKDSEEVQLLPFGFYVGKEFRWTTPTFPL